MRTKLSKEEQDYFVKRVSKGMKLLPHKIADPSSVTMFWNDKYNLKNGILGSFMWYRSNEIDLSPVAKDAKHMIVGIVAHELHHKWQFQNYKLIYFLMAIPFIREYFLEKTADEVESAMDKLMEDKEFRKI